jgi:acyl-CoA synthetase (AMP-forming)/AMP-acid ligase II
MADLEGMMPLDVNIATSLEHIADLRGDTPAVVQGATTVSWSQFDDQASRLAGFLAERGVSPGDAVAIGARNRPEYLVAVLAALKLRAVPVNVNFRYRDEELHYILTDSRAAAFILDDALAGPLGRIRDRLTTCATLIQVGAGPLAPGAVAFTEAAAGTPQPRMNRSDDEWLLYTGGTTGMPKAVVRPHSSVLGAARSAAFQLLGIPVPDDPAEFDRLLAGRPADRLVILAASPLMHGTGIYGALTALASGGTVVLLPGQRFEAGEFADAISRARVTDVFIVGDVFALPLADEWEAAIGRGRPYDLSRLRRIHSVGTAWSPATKLRMLAVADVTLFDMVAATEGGPYATAVADRRTRAESLGAFSLAPGARLLDPSDADVQPGSGGIGVLAAPVPADMHYAGPAEQSSATFRIIDGIHYSVPGDFATIAADGTLRLLGRGSGVINTGGEKVYAAEVEGVLREHPEVRDAIVIGVPHPRWGSAVAAIIEAAPGATPDPQTIRAHVASVLASYKQPQRIAVVPELQRTASGKADLRWAAQLLIVPEEAGP